MQLKVSYNWLSDYVDVSGYSAEELAEKLTRSGIEVDVVEQRNQGVTGVVVGHVQSCERHPDADKLSLCKVDAGTGELLQIICGAKNIAAGQKVPVAKVGAVLPGNFKIKKAKLRGVESFGMICSAKELGINDRLLPKQLQEGILVLPEELEIGTDIKTVLGLDDAVMELDLTPNRSDCLSMLGTAYEIAAILDRPVKLPEPVKPLREGTDAAKDQLAVRIEAQQGCMHYSARCVRQVRIEASPLWLQNRLIAAGVRPINNIVDVTNYVMLEYGQPLHAFDADQLSGKEIIVRYAKPGEVLTTLDGTKRKLEPHMLVIADAKQPVALAGVMGGADSEVHESTVNLVLESARFAGPEVRMTSKQLGLRSESSQRFEKEVDPARVVPALDRAAALIAELSGGEVAQGIVEQRLETVESRRIELSVERINDYLGTSMQAEQVESIWRRLNFAQEHQNGSFQVEVPTRRGDITRDVDLIEEVARLYGYDHIPTTLLHGATTPGHLSKEQRIKRQLRQLLNGSGLQEAIHYVFTDPKQRQLFPGMFADAEPIELSMPMSEERSVLRTSLVPHLLDTATFNRNRMIEDISLFEIGSVFLTEQSELQALPEEQPMLAVLCSGLQHKVHWSAAATQTDFYDMKGIAESIFAFFGIDGVDFRAAQPPGFHPGRTAECYLEQNGEEIVVGWLGQIHPELQNAKDLDETYVLEFKLQPLVELADPQISYQPMPKYPAISRDLALVIKDDVEVGQALELIRESAGELLEDCRVFDIYRGENIAQGSKSVAFNLVFRDSEKTLTDDEVSAQHEKVVARLQQELNAELRR